MADEWKEEIIDFLNMPKSVVTSLERCFDGAWNNGMYTLKIEIICPATCSREAEGEVIKDVDISLLKGLKGPRGKITYVESDDEN